MTFVPASSFVPATVVVGGTVAVSNFPASQAVTGPLTDAQLAARLPLSISGAVTGPLTDAQLAARLPLSISGPVTGPLTDAQLAARLPLPVDASGTTVPVSGPLTDAQLRASAVAVDGSAVTQPVSAESLPLPDGAADNQTLSEIALAAIIEREKVVLQ